MKTVAPNVAVPEGKYVLNGASFVHVWTNEDSQIMTSGKESLPITSAEKISDRKFIISFLLGKKKRKGTLE